MQFIQPYMKKILFALLPLLFLFTLSSRATDFNSDELLSLITLTPSISTMEQVTSILGRPLDIQENKKRTWWFYNHGSTNLTLSWNNKSGQLEKFSLANKSEEEKAFDARISLRLRSGVTDINQAIAILGMPKNMTIKEVTQELHYAYKNSILRLFFRNRLLVDFTLLGTR